MRLILFETFPMRLLILTSMFFATLLTGYNCLADENSKPIALQQCGLITQNPTTSSTTANFTQQRFIKGLTKPLISRGIFQLFPGNKIVWETKAPIFSKVTISEAGFEINTTNGDSAESESFKQSHFREVSSILLSLHSLSLASIDSTTLSKRFSLQCFQLPKNEFSLVATPRDEDLAKLIQSIALRGSTTPTQITIIDGRGDQTTVELTDIQQVKDDEKPVK